MIPFDLSIIIPVLNAAATLPRLLEALAREVMALPDGLTAEVIAVDNGSRDGSLEILRRPSPELPLRLIATDRPGPAAARNAGIRQAAGRVLVLLDADCVPEAGWLLYWHKVFSSDPDLMIAGGNLLDAELDSVVARYTAATKILDAATFAATVPGGRPGFYLTANFAMRRSVIDALGLFDEALLPTGEDADLCFRADAMGLKRQFFSEIAVHHHHRTSLRGLARQMFKYGHGAAAVHAKWARPLGWPQVEVDGIGYVRFARAVMKTLLFPLRPAGDRRWFEGPLDLVRYGAFLAGRWRGSLQYRVWVI